MSSSTNLTTNETPIINDNLSSKYDDIIPEISDLFTISPSLLSHIKFNKAIDKLVIYIKEIPNYEKLRSDFNLVKRTADIIENLTFKSKTVDKKAILISTFMKVFKLSPSEVTIISDFIEFIHSNNLITKLSFRQLHYRKAKKFLFHLVKLL
jgi:hypothetical protein